MKIMVDGKMLDQTVKYRYRGAIITKDRRDEDEIISRLGYARKAYLERVL